MIDESFLWVEKYRPRCFSDIQGQTTIVERVSAFVKQKNLPHLLFSGPAGVGKSSLAIVIARELFGDSWKQNFLELNASDDRGIDVVRNQVKDFARTKPLGEVPFKLIFLDESDALTKEAQQALRRTMENFTTSTRFLLSCNYASKIIEPIQSRCVVFKFRPLDKTQVFSIIDKISKQENLKISEESKQALFEVSEGDCRRLENTLQSCAALKKEIKPEVIFSLANSAKPEEIKLVLELALKGDFINARNKLLDVMLENGLSGLDIIKQIQKSVWDLSIDGKQKVILIDKIGDIEFRMVEGSDEFLQLEALIAYFTLQHASQ
ncbi:replication factor C small subunit [Candidatus Woesearchaeota archaeon]|nr:replication factor C small subunit [Candidatus Woesearchaeota archaeon]